MNWDPVVQALGIGTPALAVAFWSYRRSLKVDATSAQSGAVTESRMGTAQIIDGLNLLVDQLQDDNRVFRDDIRHLTNRLDECFTHREELRRQVARLHRLYGNDDPEAQ